MPSENAFARDALYGTCAMKLAIELNNIFEDEGLSMWLGWIPSVLY